MVYLDAPAPCHYSASVKLLRLLIPATIAWTAAITGLPVWFSSPDFAESGDDEAGAAARYGLAYLPVTCHIICSPVHATSTPPATSPPATPSSQPWD